MTQPSAGGYDPSSVGGKPVRYRRKSNVAGEVGSKQRIVLTESGTPAVVDAKPGLVTVIDKVKAYYHTAITVLAAILVLLNEVAPAAHWIPGYGSQAAGWVSAAIVFVAAAVNFLKSNEHWVDSV
jgi:hypothetical protein